ncbi:M48 family metalloprotease [Rhodococcoides fascians]|uniref:M48 family metalloprotease n=1 Tax=Rhodococcoides fascians TaxID=1828 RepID=UPI003CF06511
MSESPLSERAKYVRKSNIVRVGIPNVLASTQYSDDALVGLIGHEMGHWFHIDSFRRHYRFAAACYLAAVLAMGLAMASVVTIVVVLASGGAVSSGTGLLFLLALAAGLTFLAAVGPLSWPEEFAADAFALNETGQQCARAHLDALNGVLNEVPGPTHPSKRRRVAALG